ncbi:MAG: ATP synthase F1 subunit gamma [Lachnospiraceae bacterium]|nr:ATP synthase F1 subunit gamma [Lachnospiraceae bacterium]
MANAKEIQNRIKSIKDTMKITKAMYLMSSMKLRKAKQKLADTEPYFFALEEEITDILLHFPNIEDIFFDNRSEDKKETYKRRAYIVMTGDKGMAGAYNHNVLSQAQELIGPPPSSGTEETTEGDNSESDWTKLKQLFVVGELGRAHFRAQKYPLADDFYFSANNPTIHRARMITGRIVTKYQKEEFDEVYLIYTRMVNSMKEEVQVQRLLPLKTKEFVVAEIQEKIANGTLNPEVIDEKDDWYLFYPTPRSILENLVYNYLTGFIYGAMVEAFASEENARMMAMQSATDNANAMLAELSIEYNRVRQAAITQEITEVISGAKALKKKKASQGK